jgi:FMN-dependent NADH-azoreductase
VNIRVAFKIATAIFNPATAKFVSGDFMMTRTTLHIDASARLTGSTTRDLTKQILDQLGTDQVIRRDLATSLPHITEDWIAANFTPADQRTEQQKQTLAQSDHLVDEIARADTLVIGLPIYNFSVPASLKAWIDLISRVGLTFHYTETGPQGLMTGKRAIVAIASGGTPVGSDMDFASGYIRHALGFIGITDVTFVAADAMAVNPEAALATTTAQVQALAA